MHVFVASINQMLVLFFFMIIGYFLRKKNFLADNAGTVLAKMENMIFIPALIINTFMKNCTIKNLLPMFNYIIYCVVIIVVEIILAYILSSLFSKDRITRKIYQYSFVVANFAFVGNAIVQSVFGDDMLFTYMVFTLPLYMFTYSIGVAWLIPTQNGKFSFKSFLNPIFISLLVGIFLGLTSFPVPDFFTSVLQSASLCMSPLAMILTGFVVGGYKLKLILSNKKVYLASIIRLILIPTFFVLILKMINTPTTIITVTLCCLAAPLGLNTIIVPSAYGGDTTLGASMSLISHVLSVITIPIMFLIFL